MMVFLVVTIDDPLSADAEVGVVGMYFCADLAAMVASIRLEANIDHNQGNRHGHEPPFQLQLHSWDDPNLPPNQPVNVMTVLFIIQAPLWLVQLRGIPISYPSGRNDHYRLPIRFRRHDEPFPYNTRRISD